MPEDARSDAAAVHRIWSLAPVAGAGLVLVALLLDPDRGSTEREVGQIAIARGLLVAVAVGLVALWLARRRLSNDFAAARARWRTAPAAITARFLVPRCASPGVEKAFWLVLAGWFVAIGIAYAVGARWPGDVTIENGPTETATVLAYLAATLLAAAAARRTFQAEARAALRPWILLGLAAGCLLVAAEETDWGQTYLDYETPRSFQDANIQQDLSLHNLALPAGVPGTRWANWTLRGLGWLGGGLLPLLLLASPGFRRWMWAWNVPLPPWWTQAALFAAACLPELHSDHGAVVRENVGSELREVTIGLAVLVWAWSAWRTRTGEPPVAG